MTKTFDPATPLEEVLDFVGAADIGGALANFDTLADAICALKGANLWEEADGSSAWVDARGHLVIERE